MNLEFRALNEQDDRGNFECGVPALDDFFRRNAGQNQFDSRKASLVTHVCLSKDEPSPPRIAGYATLVMSCLEIPRPARPEIMRWLPAHPIPLLLLARLAVDHRFQGQGIGKRLLRYVIQTARQVSLSVGCWAIAAHAKPGKAAWYAQYDFVELRAAAPLLPPGYSYLVFPIAAIPKPTDAQPELT